MAGWQCHHVVQKQQETQRMSRLSLKPTHAASRLTLGSILLLGCRYNETTAKPKRNGRGATRNHPESHEGDNRPEWR